MEKRKLVRRRPDQRDRRVSRVWLTRKGASLRQEAVPAVEAFAGKMFACLSQSEINQMMDLVSRVKAYVEELA